MGEAKRKGRRYQWELWFSKSEIKLYKDKDYNGLDHGFAQYVRKAARRYGYIVSVKVGVGELKVTISGRIQPDPSVHNNDYRDGTREFHQGKFDKKGVPVTLDGVSDGNS